MNKISWLYNRWKHFVHPWEELYRIRQKIQNSFIDKWYSKYYLHHKRGFELLENISLYKEENILKYIDTNIDASDLKIKFGNVSLSLNGKIEWRKDYKNNIVSKPQYFADIDKNCFEKVGELKYALEPNRFTFLPSYIAYYYINKEPKNLYSPIDHIKDWITDNPFLYSFNWTDGIEVGIRATNIIFGILIIKDLKPNVYEKYKNMFRNLILEHYYFLKCHPSLYSSANNHRISELLGLIVISAFYQKDDKDLKSYLKELKRLTPLQYFKDGFGREQSTHYFKCILSIYAICYSVLSRLKKNVDYSFIKQQLLDSRKAFNYIKVNENFYFNWGDNDCSVIIGDVTEKDFNEYESVQKDLSYLKRGTADKKFDFRNYLLWGNAQSESSTNTKKQTYYFADSKYLFEIRPEYSCFVNMSYLGFKYLGAHGHSDLMSFQLYYGNKPMFIDCGTYQYHNKYLEARNYFRSINAHNTLKINRKNHAEMLSNMMWASNPSVYDIDYKDDCISGCIKIDDITHERCYTFNNEYMMIYDEIDGKGSFEIFYNIDNKWDVRKDNGRIIISDGYKGAEMSFESDSIDNIDINHGKNNSYDGWCSDIYDQLTPCYQIVIKGTSKHKCKINTVIKFKH